MQRLLLMLCAFAALSTSSLAQSDKPLLLRRPTVSRTQIAFGYGGDLWIVGREGGEARHLTSGVGFEATPVFSPDGSMIAFTGEYDGNVDVFVIPSSGGVPKRLTYHPDPDVVVGWTPDGKNILFRSTRSSYHHFDRLFTIPVSGGLPRELPLPMAEEGSYSADGTHLAYVPNPQWQRAWKRYRGGQTTPIWIANLADSSVEAIPRENSNDSGPMWIGNTIYFLSDRNGAVSLFAYDTGSNQVTEVVKNNGLDLKSASAAQDAIVYEQFGSVFLYDLNSHQSKKVDIQVSGDLAEVRPHFAKVKASQIRSFSLSPTAVRAVGQARGDIFTIPADKGDIRNLTRTPGSMDRDPAWSPDGKSIAYLSDESGEYQLCIRDQNGLGDVRKISLGNPPSFFYAPQWSPDSKKISYTDKRLNLWYVDVDTAKLHKVDTDLFDTPERTLDPSWAPDSKWIAYTKQLPSHLHGVFLYSLDQGKLFQVTDGLSDSRFARFDKNGKYLYFAASTDIGLGSAWLDMSSLEHPLSRSIYAVVLSKEDASPLAPESDEEKAKEEAKKDAAPDSSKDKGKGKKDNSKDAKSDKPSDKDQDKDKSKDEPVVVRVDQENIGQRIVALPIPARNYLGMDPGKTGILFLAEGPTVLRESDLENLTITVQKFDLSKRKVDKFLEEINDFSLSDNGEKMLYRKGEQWSITSLDEPPSGSAPPKPGEGPLKLEALEIYVDPPAGWRQMYREAWRIQRDFLYDPNAHGLDLKAAEKKYEPYLDRLASRDDLTYLFEEMLGEITVGHMFTGGGDRPEAPKTKNGLLGADYSLENGRYRIAHIFNGENWNPELRAPLTQPGVNVRVGEYILGVNGRELKSSDNIYSFFEQTAGRQTLLKVGANPDGKDARDVTVVPVDSEDGLRRLAWVEGNRRKVDELTGGKVAYVYMPNTGGGGFTSFNRYFFAQVGKQAVILDERFNEGGDLADYVIDYLRRPVMSLLATREGAEVLSPSAAIYGPKVMLINQQAGSGGDAMPWYFRKAGLGPLVGKKTWGGLVGIYDYPELMDGAFVTAPRAALYGLKGEWEVENHGIPPDVEVELDPKAVRQGHDPQLEKAVEVVLQLLKEHPLQQYKRPEYPNYHKAQ
jgi:tricorn protease